MREANTQLAAELMIGCSGDTDVTALSSSAVLEYFFSSCLRSLFSATPAIPGQFEAL
jgi:hypothetical protein